MSSKTTLSVLLSVGTIFVCSPSLFAGTITQIIDSTGDGAGHTLGATVGLAADSVGNIYVVGIASSNAFMITPEGVITQIIDSTGDGAGHALDRPQPIAVDTAGNVYIGAWGTHNAFKPATGNGTRSHG